MTNPPIALEDRGEEDGRLFSPSAGRNKDIIAGVLSEVLPQSARVLEIASGTGEHGMAALSQRSDLVWHFSDPDAQSRASQAAWMREAGIDLAAPRDINTMQAGWTDALPKFDAIFCANMIHIAPWEAALGLAEGAAACLDSQGTVCLYGPFKDGDDTAPSNLDFDISLKSRNPAWGVRELDSVKHIFAKHGFNQMTRRDMPKNNLFLAFSR